jgi:hypothetical protein
MLHIPGGTANGCGFAGGLGWNQWYFDCIQRVSPMRQSGEGRSRRWITAMKDTFSSAELTALRNDLIHDFLIDSREAAELLQLFLTGRGFGASPEAARDAVGRVERSGCSIPVLQRELEDLALVM